MMNTTKSTPVLRSSVSALVASAHRVLQDPMVTPVDRAMIESCLVVMPNDYAREALEPVVARYV